MFTPPSICRSGLLSDSRRGVGVGGWVAEVGIGVPPEPLEQTLESVCHSPPRDEGKDRERGQNPQHPTDHRPKNKWVFHHSPHQGLRMYFRACASRHETRKMIVTGSRRRRLISRLMTSRTICGPGISPYPTPLIMTEAKYTAITKTIYSITIAIGPPVGLGLITLHPEGIFHTITLLELMFILTQKYLYYNVIEVC